MELKCSVCGLSFQELYGLLGKDYIHVHHLIPLSTTGKILINPERDLRPICPNCHSMLHKKDPPLAISELKEIMERSKK